jgi:hypothetical protein
MSVQEQNKVLLFPTPTTRKPIEPSDISLSDKWDRCASFIDAALDHSSGTHSLADVFRLIASGEAQFWPFEDAAIVTEIVRYPQRTILRFWLAGGKLETLLEAEPEVIEWSKRYNCEAVEIIGRRGWNRALNGYKSSSSIMIKEF